MSSLEASNFADHTSSFGSKRNFDDCVSLVVEELNHVTSLYPVQNELLDALYEHENIFFTSCTNSGKTLPAIMFAKVIKKLQHLGSMDSPKNPKTLFITHLNSLQQSLVNNTRKLGIECDVITSENVKELFQNENKEVLFIGPEVLKQESVSEALLSFRNQIVLRVVDEAHLGKEFVRIVSSLHMILLFFSCYLGY